jgi:hypothetical protein
MIEHKIIPIDDKKFIKDIIEYLEKTDDSTWCVDVVKTKNGKNCLFGHIFDLGGSKMMDMFEEIVATTYMVYPVNDGENPKYQQETPKLRCIAYLQDILDGKARSTLQLLEDEEIYTELRNLGITNDQINVFISNFDKKVTKTSKEGTVPRPFKSTFRTNTIKGLIVHPHLKIPAYTFYEDDSYVECRRCVIL